MIFVILVFCCWVLSEAEMVQMKVQTYKPPTQEELLNAYFKDDDDSGKETGSRTKKSVWNTSDKFYEILQDVNGENITDLGEKSKTSNKFEMDVFGTVQNAVKTGLKNYLTIPIEPTTYRYPTAIWSSQTYEKYKNNQKNRVKPAFRRIQPNSEYESIGRVTDNFTSEKSQRRNRGKIKWKDAQLKSRAYFSEGNESYKMSKTDFVDKFLEQSLSNYLTSSNLKETVGNVSVKTFSELLRNVTEQKTKRPQSPYDENKELRMKFREEVILKKKTTVPSTNDTKTQGKFLEKQLQKRLEKVQDMFNERDKEKILANMWKYVTLNRTTDSLEDIKDQRKKEKNKTEESEVVEVVTTTPSTTPFEEIVFSIDWDSTTEKRSVATTKPNRGKIKYNKTRLTWMEKPENDDIAVGESDRRNLLKLTAEESSYYRQGKFPSLTFIGQPEKPGVIPGTPYVDYPVHSFPPATKFKCPKFKGGKPKMMADKETRCQVFYVCTGDGPTTAMLCPNGTMFNENFLVCDWWYNVHC